jgi:hypothetical protein
MAETMDRRRFLSFAASGVAVGALFALQGCSSGSSSSPTPTPDPTYSDKNGVIGTNHGHSVTLTAAQQQAGEAVTLTLTTGTGHTHTVDFNAQAVKDIAAGIRRDGTSSVDSGHYHSVSFS